MEKQRKIKKFEIKGTVMHIEKLNNGLQVYVPQNTTVPQNTGFLRSAIISEGKEI